MAGLLGWFSGWVDSWERLAEWRKVNRQRPMVTRAWGCEWAKRL